MQSLYDFKKRKEVFVWVPNTALYWELQEKFIHIAFGDHSAPVTIRRIMHKNRALVFDSLTHWVSKYGNRFYHKTRLSQIFYTVCIINIKGDNIQTLSYDKESISLDDVQLIKNNSQNFDASIAFSFIILAEKYSSSQPSKEILVASILYDIKSRQTLCFNIKSVTAFYEENKYTKNKPVLADVATKLFELSISKELECSSFIPLPISTQWYTAMPLLTYITLQPIKSNTNAEFGKRNLNIPEFLTFGCPEFFTKGNSFVFTPFSSTSSGRSTCILKFNDNDSRLTYNLRYDQWSGETQVHADYSFYDPREVKLLEHYMLDLEDVYSFNSDLFIAILASGLYDARFSTIIEKGLKGSAELVRKNPAYFYPLNQIGAVQRALDWLEEQPERYDHIEKLLNHEVLTSAEKETIEYLRTNFIGVIAGKDDGKLGIGLIGDAIRARRYRNMTKFRM